MTYRIANTATPEDLDMLTTPTRKNKYGNVKVVYDGETFDSKREAERWKELKLLEAAGEIRNLQRQKKFSIDIGGVHVCNYIADFFYFEIGTGHIVEDSKSVATQRNPTYRLKRKLMKAVFRIDIRETGLKQ